MAANECAKRVGWKLSVQRFMADKLCQCKTLRDEILAGTWKTEKGSPFYVHERGKTRYIVPPTMRTRVVERCFCDQVLTPFVLRSVVEGCGACLPGRGLSYATDKIREILKKVPPGGWIVLFDFHDYFNSIPRLQLLENLEQGLPRRYVDIASICIGGTKGKGLDLGSHVCQTLAVWYPTPIDHVIIDRPGCIGYTRYMDDGFAAFDVRERAISALSTLEKVSSDMGLSMNPNKTFSNRATTPFSFCKRRFVKRKDGVRMVIRKSQTRNIIRHDRRVVAKSRESKIDLMPVKAATMGYLDSGDAHLSSRLMQTVDWGSA